MGTSAQDSKTQKAASTAAQDASATQAANAATAQTNSNNQQTSLFGSYNPSTNSYTGGSESQFLDPSALNTTGLTGAYSNLYNSQANTTAKGAQDAVSSTIQNLNSRGMGQTPAGFAADQQRKAFQDQAAQNSTNYATDFGNQHQEAVNQYNNANQLLSNTQTQNQNSATANNANAAGTNTSLYGTASQQKQSPWGTVLGGAAGLAGAAATAYAGR